MKAHQADLISEALVGVADVEEREDYSGKGMYGKTTIGLVVNLSPDEIKKEIVKYYSNDNINPYAMIMSVGEILSFRSDNLGLGYIIY